MVFQSFEKSKVPLASWCPEVGFWFKLPSKGLLRDLRASAVKGPRVRVQLRGKGVSNHEKADSALEGNEEGGAIRSPETVGGGKVQVQSSLDEKGGVVRD